MIAAQKLPRGPKGSWLPTLKLIRDPKGALTSWSQEFGDPFLMHALNGKVVVTGSPSLVHDIFSHDAFDFDVFAYRTILPILGQGSLLLLSGEEHRKERKLLMPMFHGERMRAYGEIIQQTAFNAIDKHSALGDFHMLDAATDISLEVIVRAIFGGEDTQDVQRLIERSKSVVKNSSPLLFFSKAMQFRFMGISPWDKFEKSTTGLREAFEDELARRAASPQQREDILTMLMEAEYDDGSKIEKERAFDELSTFLFAGHETTAVALSWAVYHLLSNPSELERLRTELRELGSLEPALLAQAPFLRAVVQETLRIHPIVTEVLRVLKSPMQLGDYSLPAGMAVAAASVLTHYDESIYPDANRFWPQRFLDRKYSSSEYFPFGGGHRRCAGAAFATYEMAIVLGSLFGSYDFKLLEQGPVAPKRRNVTMGPSRGILVSTAKIK